MKRKFSPSFRIALALIAIIFSFFAGIYFQNFKDFFISFFVKKEPPAFISPPFPIKKEGPKLAIPPDLTIQFSAVTPIKAREGNVMTFLAAVKNEGSDSSSFASRLFIDVNNDRVRGDAERTMPILILDTPSLEGRATKFLKWQSAWVAIPGIHRYEICVDVGLVVTESNEENNCASELFVVK